MGYATGRYNAGNFPILIVPHRYRGIDMTEYTIIFEANGGVGNPPASVQYEEGATVTLPTEIELTKEGFVFGGWAESDDGKVPVDEPYLMPDKETTLYAIWVVKEEDGEEEGGQPEEMTFDEFIAECDRIIGLCRDLKDARDYDKGIQARQVVKETSQDKIMGLREDKVVKIRNYGFDL